MKYYLLTCSLANCIASFNNVSLIYGPKSFLSNSKNVDNLLLLLFPNHFITRIVFFHSFTLNLLTNFVFIWSNICLLVLPISFLDEFMSLFVGWLVKFSLWSFMYISRATSHQLWVYRKTNLSTARKKYWKY